MPTPGPTPAVDSEDKDDPNNARNEFSPTSLEAVSETDSVDGPSNDTKFS